MTSLAERFSLRFAGLDRAYGTYDLPADKSATNGHKKKGEARTVHEAPTVELWEGHLTGKQSIGIVPIRDDGTVVFGAIDIDIYNLNHAELAKKIEALDLPLIPCTTKSGGAHLYLFCREPIPAALVREKLMEWSVHLGYSGSEVFPKQTRLASKNDHGSWINMPYFGGDDSSRYAFTADKKFKSKAFLDHADRIAVDRDTLKDIKVQGKDKKQGDLLEEAPPCLVTLTLRGGIAQGTRNSALFNFGVYLRKRYGEGWEKHFDKYNQTFMKPPVGERELATLVTAVMKKEYDYKCKDQPICDVCNKQVCYTRQYGVGAADGDPGVVFGNLIKVMTDPVTWIWDVDGARIELTTIELKDQARFHTRAMEELNKWPNPLKPIEWSAIVRVHLEKCEVMEVPEDARPGGQVWMYLEQYCTGTVRAKNKEELLQKKPWTNEGRVYFNGPHFLQWLAKQGQRFTPKQLWNWLREGGAEPMTFKIKDKPVSVWSVEAFDETSGDLAVPTIDNVEEM